MKTIKEILKTMDQNMDDLVSGFHNRLSVLFLIILLCLAVIIGISASPWFLFQEKIWMKCLAIISILTSPALIGNAVFAIRSAGWHFGNTLDKRVGEWLD